MQAFVDLIGGITFSIQRVIAFVLLAGVVVAGIFVYGVSATAPVVADKIGERAERIGERAIQAAQEEHRAAQMADEGWGYSDSESDSFDSSGMGTTSDPNGESVGGWGAE